MLLLSALYLIQSFLCLCLESVFVSPLIPTVRYVSVKTCLFTLDSVFYSSLLDLKILKYLMLEVSFRTDLIWGVMSRKQHKHFFVFYLTFLGGLSTTNMLQITGVWISAGWAAEQMLGNWILYTCRVHYCRHSSIK